MLSEEGSTREQRKLILWETILPQEPESASCGTNIILHLEKEHTKVWEGDESPFKLEVTPVEPWHLLPVPGVPQSSSVSPPPPLPAFLKLPTWHCEQFPKYTSKYQMLLCRKDHWRTRSEAKFLSLHGVSSDPESRRAECLWRVSGARRLCPNSRSLLGKVRNSGASQEVSVPKFPPQSLKVCNYK